MLNALQDAISTLHRRPASTEAPTRLAPTVPASGTRRFFRPYPARVPTQAMSQSCNCDFKKVRGDGPYAA